MKKFLAILVTMALLVSSICIALPSSAADKTADYVVTAEADYAAKKVSVKVEITSNPGLSMAMMDLTYDPDVLTCTSGAAGNVWTGDVTVDTAKEDMVVFYAVPEKLTDVITATGVVFTAEFDLKAGAAEDAEFGFALVAGQNDPDNHYVVESGDFVNVAIDASYEGHKALVDAKPNVPVAGAKLSFSSELKDDKYYVYCDIAENPGIWAGRVFVDYNADALKLNSVVTGEVLSVDPTIFNKDRCPAVVLLEAPRMVDDTANGRMFTLVFDIVDCGKDAGISAEIDSMINASGEDVVCSIEAEVYADLEHRTAAGAAPDCTTSVNCEVCGAVVVPALGHTEVPVAGTPADCENDGLTDGVQCSVCQEWITPQEVDPAKGHTPAEAVKENVVPATCTVDGSYDEVVYCSVCGDELSREAKVDAAKGHTPAEAVRENEVPADCDTDGSYDEVVYCDVCGDELSRENKVDPAKGHTPAEAVRENEVPADCDTDGSYDEVVYCDVCGDELSRENKVDPAKGHTDETIPGYAAGCTTPGLTDGVKCSVCGDILVPQEVIGEKGHTPAAAVKENEVPATCTVDGSYDEVVYCSVCGDELSRENKVDPAKGHTPAAAVKENEVPATCAVDGSYDEVVYCDVCGDELSRENKVDPAKGHTPAEAVKENVVPATCTVDGSYDEVVYCSVCGDELSRENKVDPAKGHTPAAAVKENEVPATCTVDGSYDEVVYCSVCGDELSRENKVDPAKGHTPEVVPAVPSTCTETGLTEGSKCSVCDEVLVAQEEVAALGHLPEDELTLVPGYAATEDKEGLTDALVCDRCGETVSGGEVIEKLPAEDKDPGEDKEPTPPQTGDNMTFIIIIAAVAAVACVVLVVYSKKRTTKASK